MIHKCIIYFADAMPYSVRNALYFPCSVHYVCRVTLQVICKPKRKFEIFLANSELLPPIGHCKVCQYNVNLPHLLTKTDFNMNDAVCQSLHVLLQGQIKKKHIPQFLMALACVNVISVEFRP